MNISTHAREAAEFCLNKYPFFGTLHRDTLEAMLQRAIDAATVELRNALHSAGKLLDNCVSTGDTRSRERMFSDARRVIQEALNRNEVKSCHNANAAEGQYCPEATQETAHCIGEPAPQKSEPSAEAEKRSVWCEEHESFRPCSGCKDLQPYSPSCYPGEYGLVKCHPLNEGSDWYKRADVDARIAELTAEVERLTKDIACDVCGGSGTPVSGRKCVCDGTGKASQAAHNFRLQLYDATADRDRLAAELAAEEKLRSQFGELVNKMEGERNKAISDLVDAKAKYARENTHGYTADYWYECFEGQRKARLEEMHERNALRTAVEAAFREGVREGGRLQFSVGGSVNSSWLASDARRKLEGGK